MKSSVKFSATSSVRFFPSVSHRPWKLHDRLFMLVSFGYFNLFNGIACGSKQVFQCKCLLKFCRAQ